MTSTKAWPAPADLVSQLRRRWDRGDFLTDLATDTPWTPVGLPIRTPTAADITNRFAEVQQWVTAWRAAENGNLRLEFKPVGGRITGTNRLPCRAWIDTPQQLWNLLGVTGKVRRFTDLLTHTRSTAPLLADMIAAQPHKVLVHEADWIQLLRTALWIEANATPQTYLRQIDVPGVDTKYIEQRRTILADILDRLLPDQRIDRTQPPANFAARYRMRTKPAYIRLRLLDPAAGTPFTEMTVRAEELALHPPQAPTILVVENETTFLALPPVPGTTAILGGGYAVPILQQLPWLAQRRLYYWGDLDTHGFAILHRLRRSFPHTTSLLMDRATLLNHRDHWVREPNPTEALPTLDDDEAALYHDLVHHRIGDAVRLEQEFIRYSTVNAALNDFAP
ncbi:hypothetical protein Aca07nite_67850 [Actinoplanes capillaceus]|uniref:Wadjet protein JetD C-terminal domain-containing protein n=1 Tax=Actinoplanes campanulatus TaxID=113559 RepID=A0ABQ3WTA6_9ACTN|nr:Wadjet anti-phage system protein JetD domain-containing protein [Actinoplanes capillaceus]GID49510.1 hypothetical protein Aca07nite_67850 [Actinoplanes capillaceus]